MTQEEKQLLLTDLCARLPYGVKVYNTTFEEPTIQTLYGKKFDDEFLMEETYTSVGIDGDDFGSFNKRHYIGYVDSIKPYLRPMSSMTSEEEKEVRVLWNEDFYDKNSIYHCYPKTINFYNKHYLDYRGLIEKGLALEAPEGMYKI